MKNPIRKTKPEHYITGSTMILVNLSYQKKNNENKYSLEQIIETGGILQWHLKHYNRHTLLNDYISEETILKIPIEN